MRKTFTIFAAAMVAASVAMPLTAAADEFLPVFGGGQYSRETGGYVGVQRVTGVNNDGLAIGSEEQYGPTTDPGQAVGIGGTSGEGERRGTHHLERHLERSPVG